MNPTVRIFKSEKDARDAAAKLAEAGYGEPAVLVADQLKGKEAAAVKSAVEEGMLPGGYTAVCTRSLQQGRSLVGVRAPFGQAQRANNIMADAGAVETDQLKPIVRSNPAPFSDVLSIPTLSQFVSSTELPRSDWSVSAGFGLPLLSRRAAPFSSMFGMKLLTSEKTGRKTGYGMPLLSRNPAPMSSLLFGLKTVISPKKSWNWSFGLPLLSRNPAPFSSLFGVPLLTRDRSGSR